MQCTHCDASNRPEAQSCSQCREPLAKKQLSPGTKVANRFRVLDRIGDGAAGQVFEAIDETLGRHVALKILAPEHASSASTRDRFNQRHFYSLRSATRTS